MRSRSLFLAISAALGLVLAPAGCRQGPPGGPPGGMPPPAVTVTRPVTVPVQTYSEYNGYLEGVETVEVRARVKGFLDAVNFREGEEVQKGQSLYTIDPREYEAMVAQAEAGIERANADAANAQAQIRLSQSEVERTRRSGRAASDADLEKAEANLAATEAALKTAVANRNAGEASKRTAMLELEFTRVKSPINGRIGRTLVTQGNLVGQNESTLLTTIVRMDELYIYFDAAERDLIEYQRATVGEQATSVQLGVATEEGYPHTGTIDFRENRVDVGTGTVRVRGRLKNPFAERTNSRPLYPGLFARVRVPNGPPRSLVSLPEDAIQTAQEGQFVFVLNDKNEVAKRSVRLGPPVWRAPLGTEGPRWTLSEPLNPPPPPPEGAPPAPPGPPPGPLPVSAVVSVLSGLSEKDRVVVIGVIKARPGQEVAPEERELRPAPAGKEGP